MKTLGYYNGKFGPLEEMTVPMNDRACYFGDGVYEATLARNGKIFALKEHLDRFFNSAGLIKIDIPYTKDELAAILYDMLAKMDDKDIFIYWQMTRGTGIRQHRQYLVGVLIGGTSLGKAAAPQPQHLTAVSQQRQQRPFGLRYAKFIIIFFECFSQMASCRAEEVPRLPCAQNSIPLYFSTICATV